MEIKEIATGKWPSILVSLGIPETFLKNRHGPCPMCGGKDRFRFDDKEGRGTWYCNACGSGDGPELLKQYHGWDFKEAFQRVKEVAGAAVSSPVRKRNPQEHADWIRRTWESCFEITEGDAAWKYLTRRVGQFDASPSLRFHPNLWFDRDRSFPALVAVVRSVNGHPVTLHRTYLTPQGEKANVDKVRKLMPTDGSMAGAAIRLGFGPHIGIAEGIETALAAARLFGIPVWSGISADGLEKFQLTPSIERLTVFGDNDLNFTGQSAAYALAHRVAMTGKPVEVNIPEAVKDWADL